MWCAKKEWKMALIESPPPAGQTWRCCSVVQVKPWPASVPLSFVQPFCCPKVWVSLTGLLFTQGLHGFWPILAIVGRYSKLVCFHWLLSLCAGLPGRWKCEEFSPLAPCLPQIVEERSGWWLFSPWLDTRTFWVSWELSWLNWRVSLSFSFLDCDFKPLNGKMEWSFTEAVVHFHWKFVFHFNLKIEKSDFQVVFSLPSGQCILVIQGWRGRWRMGNSNQTLWFLGSGMYSSVNDLSKMLKVSLIWL